MSNIIFSPSFINELLVATIRMTIPLLLVAIGELYSERVGLVNIGLDGIMTIGALFGFLITFYTKNPLLGALGGALAGAIFNMVFALATVTFNSDQIVNGMALNILGPALATFIYRGMFGIKSTLDKVPLMKDIKIPVLGDIPVIGRLFFNHSPIVYISILIIIITYLFLNKTKKGLNYRAVGEYPRAAESMGINVIKNKYIGCILCGLLAGLGGAYLTTCYISSFSDGIVSGRGFIALSAVIFGRWKVFGVLLATLLFGFTDALQLRFQIINTGIPYQILAMLPYGITLITLVLFGSKSIGPKASGKPYFRESK